MLRESYGQRSLEAAVQGSQRVTERLTLSHADVYYTQTHTHTKLQSKGSQRVTEQLTFSHADVYYTQMRARAHTHTHTHIYLPPVTDFPLKSK